MIREIPKLTTVHLSELEFMFHEWLVAHIGCPIRVANMDKSFYADQTGIDYGQMKGPKPTTDTPGAEVPRPHRDPATVGVGRV